MKRTSQSQLSKFREAARELEADENEDAFNAAVKAVAKGKNPVPHLERLADGLGQNGDKPKRK